MMIDHVGLRVKDLGASLAFYDKVLEAIGMSRTFLDEELAGYGEPASFWLHAASPKKAVASGAHIAFKAPTRAAVERFHRAGLAHGGSDNGSPGPRPDYGEDYFAGFLVDPDGNNVEAVHQKAD